MTEACQHVAGSEAGPAQPGHLHDRMPVIPRGDGSAADPQGHRADWLDGAADAAGLLCRPQSGADGVRADAGELEQTRVAPLELNQALDLRCCTFSGAVCDRNDRSAPRIIRQQSANNSVMRSKRCVPAGSFTQKIRRHHEPCQEGIERDSRCGSVNLLVLSVQAGRAGAMREVNGRHARSERTPCWKDRWSPLHSSTGRRAALMTSGPEHRRLLR